nr:uncharacterized protein LOC100180042 [Ciona intestinalis]|eukprot:XP_002121925.1 uncharacterized protein LOC100180042 [Ciona intestinalis]
MEGYDDAREMVPMGDVTNDARRDIMGDELLQELRSAEAFVSEGEKKGENREEEGSLRHTGGEKKANESDEDATNEVSYIGSFGSDSRLNRQLRDPDCRSIVSAGRRSVCNKRESSYCDEEYNPLLRRSGNSSVWSVSSLGSRTSNNKRRSRTMGGEKTGSQDDVARLPVDDVTCDVTSGEEFVVVDETEPKEEGDSSKHPSRDASPSNQEVEEPKKKKKKKRVRGLDLPVQVFKSRSERDPEFINQDLRVNFDDVIAEPEGYYTPKYSWHLSKEVYGFSKGCCYSVASFFCSVPAAFLWGIWFAFIACLNIWLLVPFRRCHNIKMSLWKGFWGVTVSSIFDPIFQSIGMVFNNMRVQTDKYEV